MINLQPFAVIFVGKGASFPERTQDFKIWLNWRHWFVKNEEFVEVGNVAQ